MCYFRVLFSAPVTSVKLNVSDDDHLTVGDVISCLANTGYPPVSYQWQQYLNKSWRDVIGDDDDGSKITLSSRGIKRLRCVAYNVVGNKTHRITSDKVTLYVGVEKGKCF